MSSDLADTCHLQEVSGSPDAERIESYRARLTRATTRSANVSRTYTVKEIFRTLQGEGFHTGTPAVFCRFAGCNLWSGREEDRANAVCRFCDTDFVGGEKYGSADELADAIETAWGPGSRSRFVVLTGGEPLLQVDAALLKALRVRRFFVAVESNGTLPAPGKIDWLTLSPKAGTALADVTPSEIKLVFPQAEVPPSRFEDKGIRHLFLQPMDGPNREENTAAAIAYCLAHPQWRLSLQTHKVLGIR